MSLNDNFIAIEPGLLHKGSSDDVLICNPRNAILNSISDLQYNMLDDYFRGFYIEQGGGVYNYNGGLFSLCPEGVLKSVTDYDGNQDWVDSRGIPFQITEKDQANTVFPNIVNCATSLVMINDAKHYYFYRKFHEHVPGVMFMEVARQAVYYHLYTHTEHQCGEITLTLDSMNSKFFAYAELMYPIELVVDDLADHQKANKPKHIHYRVSFYQCNKLLAVIDSKGAVIKLGTFKNIRNIDVPHGEWFAPLIRQDLTAELLQGSESTTVKLEQVSTDGAVFSIDTAVDFDNLTVFKVSLTAKMSFQAAVTSCCKVQQGYQVTFDELPSSEEHALLEIIKRAFIHSPEVALLEHA
ncbi:hypothetical protein BGP78_09745 [Pseudoalteromonas sp. MSK9-3]|uniref:AfsA-related hotdog domain-containing protein n=1 Tax=Pseudoalteromonas sp. MSK9-3 TaxID=1897633 RepID=UPI000E6C0863|nr:AfsA-related hotdog domain-containing protein [Pseudoalteromonas sp. MSK9-3]RJE77174.1 hypothetical protein BGP78_09745 [Pseudoalteromonas sp. MSK9-3]